MRLYKAQTSALVLMAVISAAPFARADKKDDLYAKGSAAESSGNVFGAKDAFCELADQDAGFKDSKVKCDQYKTEVAKAFARWEKNYLDGLQAKQDGKYDEAENKFRFVKAPSPRLADAQAKLAEVI